MNGLTKEEVNQRKEAGLINYQTATKTKSKKAIFYHNIVNYFNILNIVLAMIIILSGHYKNVLFMGVIIFNTFIAIFQELKSKKMVDSLTLLVESKIKVIRDNETLEINNDEIVVDDLIIVGIGNQIPVDCKLVDGYIEVDESNLTGESDTIHKHLEDAVYSGSVVVSGNAVLKVQFVGENCRINKIISQTKANKKHPSALRDTLDNILKIITIAIIPVGILMYLKNKYVFKLVIDEVILKSVAPLIGMIPEGLILLTSVALAVGVYKLAKKNVLVQELYCIETLARVDVLCVDKTGTITEGRLQVVETLGNFEHEIANYINAFEYGNASEQAIEQHFGKLNDFEIINKLPFNSKRKFSAVTFKKEGTYLLGAYEFMFKKQNQTELSKIQNYINNGYRVLAFAKSEYGVTESYIPDNLQLVGFIILSDVIRENTAQIFDFFKKQNVAVKVISGDHPLAVSAIAKKAGLQDIDAIDASTLSDEQLTTAILQYNVFGRVTPEQKQKMVDILQQNKKTVAMTGDGVNDVLALKKANVSIAMAQGCDAAKQISNIVLLKNDFQSLYDILMEGRRVINNIQKVATLFLVKTILTIILALISLLTPIKFPFIPIQLTLVSALTIGIPAFFLTLETNKNQISENFMKNVLLTAGSSAILLSIVMLFFSQMTNYYTIATVLAVINGLMLVMYVGKPLNNLKKILIGLLLLVFVVAYTVFGSFFQLMPLTGNEILMVGIGSIALIGQRLLYKYYD